jgi:hypothetical protein
MTNAEAIESAELAGKRYARDGFSNADAACARWLQAGSTTSAVILDRGLVFAASASFSRGFVSERAGSARR